MARMHLAASILGLLALTNSHLHAQQILQTLKPGIGYAQFKQWAIANDLVFENYTRDSIIVRDTGLKTWESVRIQARFCGGDDYAGRASNIIIQQLFKPTINVVTTERDYIESIAGKPPQDGKYPGNFSVRRESNGDSQGVAISQDGPNGFWEVGLFDRKAPGAEFAMLQTVRRQDSICK